MFGNHSQEDRSGEKSLDEKVAELTEEVASLRSEFERYRRQQTQIAIDRIEAHIAQYPEYD